MNKLLTQILTLILSLTPALLFAQSDVPAYMAKEASSETYISKKIAEGYYPEIFTKINLLMQNRVEGRKNAEKIVAQSYSVSPAVAEVIKFNKAEQRYNVDSAIMDIMKANNRSESIASTTGEFTYIPNSDGKITYFKDGLASTVLHERVVDEYGKLSLKDTFNMTYNDRRLLISYHAVETDNLGNKTTLDCSGMTYSGDSVFYGTAYTNANKNITAYNIRETDDLGNTKATDWSANSYEGKFLRSFSQTIDDSIYGKSNFTRSDIQYTDAAHMISYHETGVGTDELAYESDRSVITYGAKSQLESFHDVTTTTQVDNSKSTLITDAEFTYLDTPNFFAKDADPEQNRLLTTAIKSYSSNANEESYRNEASVTNYTYDANFKLTGAQGNSTYDGRGSKFFEYSDAAGHAVSYNSADNTYSYINPATSETVPLAQDQVISTLKDGILYNGASQSNYEILADSPMLKSQQTTTNSMQEDGKTVDSTDKSTTTYTNGLWLNRYRLLSQDESSSHNEPVRDPNNEHVSTKSIATTYTYDEKANVSAAKGTGTSDNWQYTQTGSWVAHSIGQIEVNYGIIRGKAVVTGSTEDLKMVDSGTGN